MTKHVLSARKWRVRVILPDDFRTAAEFTFSERVEEAHVRAHPDVQKWAGSREIEAVYPLAPSPLLDS